MELISNWFSTVGAQMNIDEESPLRIMEHQRGWAAGFFQAWLRRPQGETRLRTPEHASENPVGATTTDDPPLESTFVKLEGTSVNATN